MSWDDDDYSIWGYNGDPVHDSWVDYTTDEYEDSDYCGWTDGRSGGAPESVDSGAQPDIRRLEKEIDYLEGALTASLVSVSLWEGKIARATSTRKIANLRRHIEAEQVKIADYRARLDAARNSPVRVEARRRNYTGVAIAIICGLIVLLSMLI